MLGERRIQIQCREVNDVYFCIHCYEHVRGFVAMVATAACLRMTIMIHRSVCAPAVTSAPDRPLRMPQGAQAQTYARNITSGQLASRKGGGAKRPGPAAACGWNQLSKACSWVCAVALIVSPSVTRYSQLVRPFGRGPTQSGIRNGSDPVGLWLIGMVGGCSTLGDAR